MRAADTPLGATPTPWPRFAVPLAGARGQLQLTPAGHPRLHFPDCAITRRAGGTAEEMFAIELERSAKGRARLRRILAGYVAARHIKAVRYYASEDRVHSLLESELRALRAHSLIEVRRWHTPRVSRLGMDPAA